MYETLNYYEFTTYYTTFDNNIAYLQLSLLVKNNTSYHNHIHILTST